MFFLNSKGGVLLLCVYVCVCVRSSMNTNVSV